MVHAAATASMTAVPSHSVESVEKASEELRNAVLKDDVNHVLMALEQPAVNIDWRSPADGKTSLHLAVGQCYPVCAALLIGRGASVQIRDNDGRTALHAALEGGDTKCIALLVDKTVSNLEEAKRMLKINSLVLSEAEKQLSGATIGRITQMVEQNALRYTETKHESEEENLLKNEGLSDLAGPPAAQTRGYQALEHVPRKSLVSEMMEISHFRTVYNIFVAILIIAAGNILVKNYFENKKVLDFGLMIWAFGKFPRAFGAWCGIVTTTMYSVYLQRVIRSKMISWTVGIIIHALYVCAIMGFAGWFTAMEDLPIATGLFIMLETTRLSMKVHSYFFVNKALAETQVADGEKTDKSLTAYPKNLTLGNFFYFLWIPTLVYQTTYPQKAKFKPLAAAKFFVQAAGCILFTYEIFSVHCLPVLPEVTGTFPQLILATFKLMLPGTLVFLLAFYGVLHCWLNAFAELTCFADRQFYLDWWNSTSWSQYYRKWNIVVHKFLYRHVYMECRQRKWNDTACMWFTFIFSAIVHEYVIAFAFGHLAPVMFVMFAGPGVGFTYLTKLGLRGYRFWNIFMWAMLIIGNGMLVSLYGRYWYFYRFEYYNDCTPYLCPDGVHPNLVNAQ
eukprot:GFYU01021351.1.p1 GENE.GFYU01021351.1~~GFYU01021351.1.p1  ORF type:complete len:618 (-),score=224.58 GFYU01021351.1:58-1911(-)